MALGLTPQEIVDKGTHPLLFICKKWERIELGYIASVQNGFAFSSKLFNHDIGIPLIRIRDIKKVKTENLYNGKYDDGFLVYRGDILIGMDGDFTAARWPGQKGLLNQRVCRVIPHSEHYLEEFLFICLQPYLDAIHQETSAVTVKHLSSKTIRSIPLPLPPLPEQRAIVTKLEQLFSELDQGIDSLQKARKQLDTYRQAVLKQAFEGELTRAWREQQTDLPSAETLLDQIQEARAAHHAQQMSEWEAQVAAWEANGKEGKKPRKPGRLKQIKSLSEHNNRPLGKIPTGWLWLEIYSVSSRVTVGHVGSMKNEYQSSGIPFLRSQNIRPNRFEKNGLKYISESFHSKLSKSSLSPGDLAIVRSGVNLGNTCVVPKELQVANCSDLVIVKQLLFAAPQYISHYLNAVTATRINSNKVGAAIPHFNTKAVEQFAVPIPPLPEQHQIVAEIESRLSVCDKLAEDIEASLKQAESLRQSLLKKAFEGRLLDEAELAACRQEPDWEPAEALLARIKSLPS